MSRFFVFLTFLCTGFLVSGQTVSQHFVDGQLYYKIANNSNIKLPELTNGNIPDNYPLPPDLLKSFQVREISRPFSGLGSEALENTYRIEFEKIYGVESFMYQLNQLALTDYVEKVPLKKTILTPNDPFYSGSQWYLPNIDASKAWNKSTSDSSVTIAITDGSISTNHEDLERNLWTNRDEIPLNGVDDDSNGYVDDVHGYDVADDDPNPNPPADSSSHGTHVAGISAAATNNATGIASIGFSASMIAVKIGEDQSGNLTAALDGIRYAIAVNADIINMSWGSNFSSITEEELLNTAHDKGIILIAGAGNSSSDTKFYPAAYDNVMAVAASDGLDEKTSFSNYGTWIDLTAPGANILSTIPTDDYAYASGTSMSSPLVAGVSALMHSERPYLPPDSVYQCLKEGAEAMSSDSYYQNGEMGAGRTNADSSLVCINNMGCPPNDTITSFYPHQQGMEAQNFPPPGWEVRNGNVDEVYWQRNTQAGGFGKSSASASINLFDINPSVSNWRTDVLKTIPFSFQFYSKPITLSFNVAYAKYDNSRIDSLIIYTSDNKCGLNKSKIWAKGGDGLSTAPATQSSFTPNSLEWRTEAINLNSYKGNKVVYFFFEAKSKSGNNIYIDDINIAHDTLASSGSKTGITTKQPLQIYPNPNNGQFSIVYAHPSQQIKRIQVFDKAGQQVFTKTVTTPKHSYTAHLKSLPKGVYIIQVTSEEGRIFNQKVAVAQ